MNATRIAKKNRLKVNPPPEAEEMDFWMSARERRQLRHRTVQPLPWQLFKRLLNWQVHRRPFIPELLNSLQIVRFQPIKNGTWSHQRRSLATRFILLTCRVANDVVMAGHWQAIGWLIDLLGRRPTVPVTSWRNRQEPIDCRQPVVAGSLRHPANPPLPAPPSAPAPHTYAVSLTSSAPKTYE